VAVGAWHDHLDACAGALALRRRLARVDHRHRCERTQGGPSVWGHDVGYGPHRHPRCPWSVPRCAVLLPRRAARARSASAHATGSGAPRRVARRRAAALLHHLRRERAERRRRRCPFPDVCAHPRSPIRPIRAREHAGVCSFSMLPNGTKVHLDPLQALKSAGDFVSVRDPPSGACCLPTTTRAHRLVRCGGSRLRCSRCSSESPSALSRPS
jgi:hypothetical protein